MRVLLLLPLHSKPNAFLDGAVDFDFGLPFVKVRLLHSEPGSGELR